MRPLHVSIEDANQLVRDGIQASIDERGELGVQVAAYLDGNLIIDAWGGIADDLKGIPVNGDTLFNVFSVTKALSATAIHLQAERGLLDYDTPIAKYWPQFASHGKGLATVRHALEHRTGIPQMPEAVTVELMCNFDWMAEQIAVMEPMFPPGTASPYHAYTFGWIVGEIVRRTDPDHRPFGQFFQEELCKPLEITNLYLGIPEEAEPRVARLRNLPRPEAPPASQAPQPSSLMIAKSAPRQVTTSRQVYERSDVQRACLPAAGGIMNARSLSRFYAMIAGGGELDGVRLLSPQCIENLGIPRGKLPDDPYDDGRSGIGGFDLDGPGNLFPDLGGFGHGGIGNSTGWAYPNEGLAIALCHNRMSWPPTAPEKSSLWPIVSAMRKIFGLPINM